MKKTIFSSFFALSSMLLAQESGPVHHIAPKMFFKKHKEGNYRYSTTGIGVEYHLKKDEGLGVKIGIKSNVSKDQLLIDSESSLFYKFWINPNHTLYPILSSEYISHVQDSNEESSLTINKAIYFGGLGWEFSFSKGIVLSIESLIFSDYHNSLICQSKEIFTGILYSNPSGFKEKIGIHATFNDSIFLGAESFFCKTFDKCYKNHGCEISLKWGF